MEFGLFLSFMIVVFGVIIVAKGALVVQHSSCVVIERLGKYNRTISSGFHIIIPFLDRARPFFWDQKQRLYSYIDLRETVIDIEEQTVITRDNVSILIDAILYVQIVDPLRAVYEIENVPLAVTQLAKTSLRNVIGEMDLDGTLSSRDVVNTKLRTILDEATDKWGIKVNRVEISNISPPQAIQVAMEKQMQAERERRAQVLEAEGDKQARIARSQGEQQESINLASGQKEAQIMRAQAEAEAVALVAEAQAEAIGRIKATVENESLAIKYLVAQRYLDVFQKFESKDGDKVYIPYEASDALSSLGGIKELFSAKG